MTEDYTEPQEVTIDSLFNNEVDTQATEDINRRAATPAGTYTTNPEEYPLNVFANLNEEKDADGAVVGKRTVATITGLAFATIKGEDVTLRLRVRISPDARKKRDFETKELTEKDDLMTRLWAQAVTTYKASVGEYPKRGTDLLEWVKSNPFKVRTFVTQEGENMAIAISPVGRRR